MRKKQSSADKNNALRQRNKPIGVRGFIPETQPIETTIAVYRERSSIPAKVSVTNVLSLQNTIGNQSVQRLLRTTHQHTSNQAGLSKTIQRRLPPIRPPVIGAQLNYPANLTTLAQSYLNMPSVINARPLVNAITNWLQARGTVNFRANDIAPGSPIYQAGPSSTARRLASRGKMSLGSAAGFTYSQNNLLHVEIYPRALTSSSKNELIGSVASYIIHEFIHILQFRQRGSFSEAQREFQTYLWQAESAANMRIPLLGTTWEAIVEQLEKNYKRLPRADRRAFKNRYVNAYISVKFPSLMRMVEMMRGRVGGVAEIKEFMKQLKEYYRLLPNNQKALNKQRYKRVQRLLSNALRTAR